ncbi:unnamed protein product [Lasius platythorax]|uniref:CCHC-type domain-containing protein n=1 Tax=Lasius platythorax TaxID=488582 RepID=A0AAV2NIC1_9HYME
MDAKLRVKNSSIKRNLTNFLNYARACQGELEELRERYERAPDVWRQFQEVQEDIAVLLVEKNSSAEDMEAHAQNIDKYEQVYYGAMATARRKLNMGNDQQEDQVAQLQAQIQALGRKTSGQEDNTLKIKLPPLTIQPFHGEYDKWLTFKDAFTQAVHNKNIPGIQKFQLFQGLLRENALKIIATLEASDVNYTIAWDLLKKRYENKRLIINTHLRGLFELAPIIKANHASLRNIIDEVRTHTRSLKALGQLTEHWSTMLTHVIANKFDGVTREEWEKEISMKELNELPTLDEILSFLEKRCLMLEMTERGKAKSETSSSTASKKTEKRIVMATITTKCAHCEGSHSIFKCEKFLKLSPYDRYTETKRLKLCTNCLKENHISRDCTLSSCRKCDLKHNTLLHRNQGQNVEMEKKNSESGSSTLQPITGNRRKCYLA